MFRWRSPWEFCFILVFAFVATPCFAQLDLQSWLESSTWTDVTGKYRTEATFVRIEQQDVVLKKSDGKEIKIPLNRLNEESRKRAIDAAKKAPAATAPAGKLNASSTPTTGPGSTALSSSSAPIAIPGNLDAKQFVDFIMNQAKNGRGIVFWDAMPAKYQQDVERIAMLVGEKIDPSVMKPINQLQSDIFKVLRTKKTFILKSPMVKQALSGAVQDDRLIASG